MSESKDFSEKRLLPRHPGPWGLCGSGFLLFLCTQPTFFFAFFKILDTKIFDFPISPYSLSQITKHSLHFKWQKMYRWICSYIINRCTYMHTRKKAREPATVGPITLWISPFWSDLIERLDTQLKFQREIVCFRTNYQEWTPLSLCRYKVFFV